MNQRIRAADAARELIEAPSQPPRLSPPGKHGESQPLGVNRAPGRLRPVVRPEIQGNERQLRDMRADALEALIAANDPPRLFLRGGAIVRVVLMQNQQCDSVPVTQPLNADAMRGELTNAADWFEIKHPRNGTEFRVEISPPMEVARDLLSLPHVDLPHLAGVITCPTFVPNGILIVVNGYHHASGLWLQSSMADLPHVSKQPTAAEVTAARDLLLDAIAEFPFVDHASRANAFALVLLPFVRPMIIGPTPLHAVDAPTAGTGKDLLVKASLLPALGYEVGVTTAAQDSDEWRKKITSVLAGGSAAIHWGNIARRLDSEHLAAVLTDTVWRDRRLGKTRELVLPNTAIWSASGNNLAFSGELTRRVVWIRLDARMEAPEQRTSFRHPDLLHYVREHRTRLVHAALTLVRAWLAAGRPDGTQVMGSYERYAAVMGGILDVAGVPGFLTNRDELRRHGDEEMAEWRAFVIAWRSRWGDATVKVADLAGLLWEAGGGRTGLLATRVSSGSEHGALTQLGKSLARKRDTIVAGFRIISVEPDKSGRQQYRLEPSDGIHPGVPPPSMPDVCPQVCPPNLSSDNGLSSDGILGILTSQAQCAQAGARTRARARETDPAGKYAKYAAAPQPPSAASVTTADLGADLGQTLQAQTPKSAGAADSPCDPACSAGELSVDARLFEMADGQFEDRDERGDTAWATER
jgi:hypothetical protein